MKFKKLLASSLLCGLCIFSSIPVHASEVEGPDTGIQRTEAALTDGVTKVTSGGYTDYTSWATKSNASSVTSGTIIARTESGVKFNGEHRLQDTSSSGWQSASTSASY